ncbi:PaaX family transcriptional regulator [Homoserinimonas sp. A447]
MTETSNGPRSQQLLLTIFGLYAREAGDALPVAAIVRMLGELGIDQTGVRSSVSRLKSRGVLESRQQDGVARYAISAQSLQIFADGDARIYHPTRARLDDPWLLAIFSVPESERARRHILRTELVRLGFGSVTSGVWIAPGRVREQAEHSLHRLGLRGYVTFFSSTYTEPGELRQKVAEWWDLDSLGKLYADFIAQHDDMLSEWSRDLEAMTVVTDDRRREAFAQYIPMFTRWRHFPFLDPGIPLELLPDCWNGQVAEQLFARLHALIGPLAHDHATALVNSVSR